MVKKNRIRNKYKDKEPLQTIKSVKGFILSQGMFAVEKWSENPSGLYSVSLEIEDTSFHVNGKGTNRAFALASAYGEFMERFQNMAFIRMHFKGIDALSEWDVNVDNTEENQEQFIQILQQQIAKKDSIRLPVDTLKKYMSLKNDKALKCCEWKNVQTHEKLLLPYSLVDYYYGTNGMVAGNTTEEAYVEGLSEIVERYVVKRFIEECLTPPFLLPELLQQFDNYQEIQAYQRAIEQSGKFRIELRDLSMGIGIPALALILYRMSDSAYFIKVGVHPVLEIALERCFTELLQGQVIDQYLNMMPLAESEKQLQKEINIHNFYVNGHGAFPVKFFSGISDFQPLQSKPSFSDNAQMKEYLINLILNLGYEIYVHDCTYSDLCAYQFVVPGMSEGISLSEKTLNNLIEDMEISDLIKLSLCNMDKQKARQLMDYLELCKFPDGMPISKLILDIQFKRNSVFNRTPICVLKLYLALFLENRNVALESVRRVNLYCKEQDKYNPFFRCFEDYLSLNNGNSKRHIREFLQHFYPTNVVDKAMEFETNLPLKSFVEIKCDFDCAHCKYAQECLTKNDVSIYKRWISTVKIGDER